VQRPAASRLKDASIALSTAQTQRLNSNVEGSATIIVLQKQFLKAVLDHLKKNMVSKIPTQLHSPVEHQSLTRDRQSILDDGPNNIELGDDGKLRVARLWDRETSNGPLHTTTGQLFHLWGWSEGKRALFARASDGTFDTS
jgi:hypothetical protein